MIMNTLMITGTAKMTDNNKVFYEIIIWGCPSGESLQFVTSKGLTLDGYNDLWQEAKAFALNYFPGNKMDDGAYTQFLEHITLL